MIRMTIEEAKEKFDEVMISVHDTRQAVVMEQGGVPFAVVMNAEEYQRYRQDRLERAWKLIEEQQRLNAGSDPDEVLAEVTEVVEEVRQELYEAEQRALQGGGRHKSPYQ
jgi:PHD/YefM family antitoxin component YafN of YafNO toxin-antitoxin module